MTFGMRRDAVAGAQRNHRRVAQTVTGCAILFIFAPSAHAQCMTRGVVDASGKTQTFTILVPPTETRDYLAQGFSAQPCMLTTAQLTNLAGGLCKLKAAGNTAVRNRLEHVLGARPDKICSSATSVLKTAGLSIATTDTATADKGLGIRR